MKCVTPFRPERTQCPACHSKTFSILRTEIQDLGKGKVKFVEKACSKCHFVNKSMELLSYKD